MLDSILENGGIPSICSAHPTVIQTAFQTSEGREVLIESTCNQVNQFGGYTGMTPADFSTFVSGLADRCGFPREKIILGGDHLGPGVWRDGDSDRAMFNALEMVRAYVRAGYTKLHLDCSLPLRDDPLPLDPATAAGRAAVLAQAAEEEFQRTFPESRNNPLHYVIGTEVPVAGGVLESEDHIQVTRAHDAEETIDVHWNAFHRANLDSAWERVIAVVVQPGVEFGDDFIAAYQSEKTRELNTLIKNHSLVYEAHSTDYQTAAALAEMVRDKFSILKVGPALTFAYREAVFALAMMEKELFPPDTRSNLIDEIEQAMLRRPEYWENYYRGTEEELAYKRMFSLSDRIRYYWVDPQVKMSLKVLMDNLSRVKLPFNLVNQFTLRDSRLETGEEYSAPGIISAHIGQELRKYRQACE